MKKIISILIALGLVLSLTVMATPASADVTKADVVLNDYCEYNMATYNITFNVTGDLVIGTTTVTITFPVDTAVPAVFNSSTNYIEVGNAAGMAIVPTTWVTVAGQSVTFYSPVHVVALVDPVVWVFFNEVLGPPAAGIVNPVAGKYKLYVSTSAPVDVTPVASSEYTIVPKYSTYEFIKDFGPTYPGIAPDFIPPFKAGLVGQVGYGSLCTTTGTWMNVFNLTLQNVAPPGCLAPCVNATVWFQLTKAVPGSHVTLAINGTWSTLSLPDPLPLSNSIAYIPGINVTLGTTFYELWEVMLSFDLVGDYELCVYAQCPYEIECAPPGTTIIAENCMEITAHQWKDPFGLNLSRKWNLISLPLVPFDSDVDAMLASLHPAVAADIISIWNYDSCSDTWYVKGQTNSFETLTDIEDGKAYWIRSVYNLTHAAGAPLGTWWIWGNAEPMPPDAPSAYAVCEGWNMVGFRSMVNRDDDDYLWNFWVMGAPLYGLMYSWDATTQGWVTGMPGTPVVMTPTTGYFIPFSVNGNIYP